MEHLKILTIQQRAFSKVMNDEEFREKLKKSAYYTSNYNSFVAKEAYSKATISIYMRLFDKKAPFFKDPSEFGSYEIQIKKILKKSIRLNVRNQFKSKKHIEIPYESVEAFIGEEPEEKYKEINLNNLEPGTMEILTERQKETFLLLFDKNVKGYKNIAKKTNNTEGGVTSLIKVSVDKITEYHLFAPDFKKIRNEEIQLDRATSKYNKKKERTFKGYYKIWLNTRRKLR